MWFPAFTLEALVDGLSDGGLHQIHIAHHLRGEHHPQMLVELSTGQVLYTSQKKKSMKINLDLNGYLLTYIGFCGVNNQVTGLCAWRFVFISNILYVVTNFNSVSIYSYNKHFS